MVLCEHSTSLFAGKDLLCSVQRWLPPTAQTSLLKYLSALTPANCVIIFIEEIFLLFQYSRSFWWKIMLHKWIVWFFSCLVLVFCCCKLQSLNGSYLHEHWVFEENYCLLKIRRKKSAIPLSICKTETRFYRFYLHGINNNRTIKVCTVRLRSEVKTWTVVVVGNSKESNCSCLLKTNNSR